MKFKDTKYGDLTLKDNIKMISCREKNLTSLEGFPKKVELLVELNNNNLTNLKYISEEIGTSLDISFNNLITLENCPKIGTYFNCSNNKIQSLKGVQQKIKGYFNCNTNNLISLKGRPLEVNGECTFVNNNLYSLEYCPKKIGGLLNCCNNPKLKNIKNQIIKYQIEANYYKTDEGNFSFEDIKEEFKNYYLNLKKNKIIKNEIKKTDYGYSF